ncbi:hypothetical protein [Ornithinimicrobium tianjinense]|uniref:Uncharacterized protein n=1 Tax=Ornithinimicrobium tianjinense TaxID=1195761 RepID=A0A917BP70_9MICO|nr:hypothetical protein [Ornithinimicrobium tianjinense]GGF53577.1 hypothetical protein GCM10011366_21710 [Ornithinimicrobium tianjinense]
MTYSGGNPTVLSTQARLLTALGADIRTDALRVVGLGKDAGGFAGDGEVAEAMSRAASAIGGVLNGTAALVDGLSGGASTAAEQLRAATGTGR